MSDPIVYGFPRSTFVDINPTRPRMGQFAPAEILTGKNLAAATFRR